MNHYDNIIRVHVPYHLRDTAYSVTKIPGVLLCTDTTVILPVPNQLRALLSKPKRLALSSVEI